MLFDKELYNINEERIEELYEIENRYHILLKEIKKINSDNEYLIKEYQKNNTTIRQKNIEIELLKKELKNKNKTAKKKYKKMKMELMQEVIYLRGKQYDYKNMLTNTRYSI